MEDKRIETGKNWLKSKSIRHIQVFLGFANFYCYFIQGFSKIAVLLTSMLKTSLISIRQLLMDMTKDEFSGIDYGKDEVKFY